MCQLETHALAVYLQGQDFAKEDASPSAATAPNPDSAYEEKLARKTAEVKEILRRQDPGMDEAQVSAVQIAAHALFVDL